MRILIADDDNFFLHMVEEILTEAGHEVVLAASGKEALAKAVTHKPDLFILDIILPGMLGTEICEKLRRFSRTAAAPILLTSSGVKEIEVTSGNAAEFLADDFIHKPFTPEILLDKIKRLEGKRQALKDACAQPAAVACSPDTDRRQHPRLPIDVLVTAQIAEILLLHPMINISQGGVYLEQDQALEVGAEVEMRFTFPVVEGLIAAAGSVAWCTEVEKGVRWGSGIRFGAVSAEDREKISRYTKALLRVTKPNGKEPDEEPTPED